MIHDWQRNTIQHLPHNYKVEASPVVNHFSAVKVPIERFVEFSFAFQLLAAVLSSTESIAVH